jgi:hypothetical protein
MPNANERVLNAVTAHLDALKLAYVKKDEENATKITIEHGTKKYHVNVYNSGSIVIGGRKDGTLRPHLEEMKAKLDQGKPLTDVLPFDYARWPQVIHERVPNVDPVIVTFVEEALKCLSADASLSCAFMLGAASERAFSLLINAYGEAIQDTVNKEKFQGRINGRMISRRYDEFMRSYKSCKTKPTGEEVGQDIETIVGLMFQFCRVTRNEIGHPEIVPDLDKGALASNLGNFVTYLDRIYRLMAFFETNPVEI